MGAQRDSEAMADRALLERYIDGVRDGYLRGIHGLPLCVDDVGLSVEELRAKYRIEQLAKVVSA